jgi:hypothetical protein
VKHQPNISAPDLSMSRDAGAYHRIANDPAVLPLVVQKGQGELDFTAFLDNPDNVGFLYTDCAFLAHCLEPGVYEVHSMALPHVRGRYVAEAAKLSIQCMFFATPAVELLTRVVEGNVAATALTHLVGFSPEFVRKAAWQTDEGPKDVSFYALRYPEWVKKQDWLRAGGEWLHSLLGDEVSHADDPAHDLYVGATVEMLLSGQVDKGCFFYNRWARFAGYETIEVVDYDPLTIDIRSHRVTLANGKVEVATCLLEQR